MPRQTPLVSLGVAPTLLNLFLLLSLLNAGEALPRAEWQGYRGSIEGAEGECLAAIGFPSQERRALTFTGTRDLPAGVYEVRLRLAASHVREAVAWLSHFTLRDASGAQPRRLATFPAIHFARPHQGEWRTVRFTHRRTGPLKLTLSAAVDEAAFQRYKTGTLLKQGGPQLKGTKTMGGDDAADDLLELEFAVSPAAAFYCILEATTLRCLSRSGVVDAIHTDKVLYDPGETLQATVKAHSVTGKTQGRLEFLLRWGLEQEETVHTLEVALTTKPQRFTAAIALPKRELGHALVARFVSANGQDTHERDEVFNIAENFMRVAMPGEFGGASFALWPEDRIRDHIAQGVGNYSNYVEWFAWAEEDMVELTPETDYWFSGQTCYHLSKAGAKRWVELLHARGVKVVTYAKFIMSGYLGWKYAYDYPYDCKEQFFFPVGLWNGTDVNCLDFFRYKEFVPYTTPWFHPAFLEGSIFGAAWYQNFLPINPDPTPRMVRVAAEEMVGAIEMFGFDAARWDGHMRSGPRMENPTRYDYRAQKQTALLIRYFKDIVNTKYPRFRHGYNCLPLETGYDWAVENYELAELCRGGGLIMNEAQGNAMAGKTYENRLQVLRVDGDLCRERGGFLLGTMGTGARERAPRDRLFETVIKSAAGCREVRGAPRRVLRWLTRYSAFVYDETMRRLAEPQKVIAPLGETDLQWDFFVYETPRQGGVEYLVVNLTNIPLDAKWTHEQDKHIDNTLRTGTAPTALQLSLPGGYRAEKAILFTPYTGGKEILPIHEGRLAIPSVSAWKMLVVKLQVEKGTAPLHEAWGVPPTLGRTRQDLKVERRDIEPLSLDKAVWEVNKNMTDMLGAGRTARFDEEPELAALAWEARNAALLQKRTAEGNQPEAFLKGWWKGGALPEDLKHKQKPPAFPDLTPRRNGVLDIYYARGVLDQRLRLYEALATCPRFSTRESHLRGRSVTYSLDDGIPWRHFPRYDVLFYADIPHGAIGVENSYALVDYVKAGGGVVFTGGEWSYGKGGGMWTILDRALWPVQCVQTGDTRYSKDGHVLEKGRDWADLGVAADFAPQPRFWHWNQVALRPGAEVKIFLKAGNRPLLVGWQLGQGRVVCLLAGHKGNSEPRHKITAFFDWADWPALLAGVLRWVAPESGRADPPPAPLSGAKLEAVRSDIEGGALEDMLAALDDDDDAGGLGLGGTEQSDRIGALTLPADKRKSRIALIRKLLGSTGPEVASLLAEQLAGVANLPEALRFDMLHFLRQHRPGTLATHANRALQDKEAAVRGAGYQMLSLAGDESFPAARRAEPRTDETSPVNRARYLTCAVALYEKDDLVDDAIGVVDRLTAEEERNTAAYTQGKGFSLAAPEQPMLTGDKIFTRLGHLTYLARWKPETYGAQFVRQWLMVGQYEYYCDNRAGNIWGDKVMSKEAKRTHVERVRHFRALLTWMGRIGEPQMKVLLARDAEQVARGLQQAHFHREARRAIQFLGSQDSSRTQAILKALTAQSHVLLKPFAAARLKQP